jgi:2-polyprenyl-3-methyl-5-hydroxy-6-metoxy-1,4-benzoquinol methylase
MSTALKATEHMTYWDHVAQTKWGSYILEVEKRVILSYQAMAGTNANAIDVGCGSGRWSKLLAGLGWNLTCIDADAHALAICKNNIPRAQCVLVDRTSNAIPAETNSAKLVLCIEVAPVLEANWFLPELNRVSKDGALFIGVHVNRRSWRGLMVRLRYFLTGSKDASVYYRTAYSNWRRGLESVGFEMIHEEGFCWGPFKRDSDSGLVPLWIRLERMLGLHRIPSISPWIVFVARKRTNN